MRKIMLTINADIYDDYFNKIEISLKYNMGELVSNYPILMEHLSMTQILFSKVDKLLAFLDITEEDVLIGYAMNNILDYNLIMEKLSQSNLSLEKVYIRFSEIDLEERKKAVGKNGRWLDYSTKDLELMTAKYDKELTSVVKQMEKDNIDFEIINNL